MGSQPPQLVTKALISQRGAERGGPPDKAMVSLPHPLLSKAFPATARPLTLDSPRMSRCNAGSDSAFLGWGPRFYPLKQFPGEAEAAGSGYLTLSGWSGSPEGLFKRDRWPHGPGSRSESLRFSQVCRGEDGTGR